MASEAGLYFSPLGLEEQHKIDGLRVAYEGYPRLDLAGFCPAAYLQLTALEPVHP